MAESDLSSLPEILTRIWKVRQSLIADLVESSLGKLKSPTAIAKTLTTTPTQQQLLDYAVEPAYKYFKINLKVNGPGLQICSLYSIPARLENQPSFNDSY